MPNNPLETTRKLLKAAELLHKLGVERLNEAHNMMKMGSLDEVGILHYETDLLFDVEKVVLEKVRIIHNALREG